MLAFCSVALFVGTLVAVALFKTLSWLRLLIFLSTVVVAGMIASKYLSVGPIAGGCIGIFVGGALAFSMMVSYTTIIVLIGILELNLCVPMIPLTIGIGFAGFGCATLVARIPGPFVQRGHGLVGYAVLIGALAAALWPAAAFAAGGNDYFKSLILFVAIFPLVNAIFDYVSYALTLTLISRGVRRDPRGRTPGWRAFIYGVADVMAAFALFTALGATLTAVIALLNRYFSPSFYPLAPVFAGALTFSPEYFWLYGMIFSTFVPTFAHLLLASVSLVSALPRSWREGIWSLYTAPADDYLKRGGGVALIGLLGTMIAVLPLVAGGALIWAIVSHYELLGATYLGLFEAVARALGEPL
jgi:hypothetical protein